MGDLGGISGGFHVGASGTNLDSSALTSAGGSSFLQQGGNVAAQSLGENAVASGPSAQVTSDAGIGASAGGGSMMQALGGTSTANGTNANTQGAALNFGSSQGNMSASTSDATSHAGTGNSTNTITGTGSFGPGGAETQNGASSAANGTDLSSGANSKTSSKQLGNHMDDLMGQVKVKCNPSGKSGVNMPAAPATNQATIGSTNSATAGYGATTTAAGSHGFSGKNGVNVAATGNAFSTGHNHTTAKSDVGGSAIGANFLQQGGQAHSKAQTADPASDAAGFINVG